MEAPDSNPSARSMKRNAFSRLRSRIDRAGYHLQQGSLAASLGLFARVFHFALRGHLPQPSKDELQALNRRFFALLEEDLANVERGVYPRALLFQFPIGAYLRVVPEAMRDVPRVIWRRLRGDFGDLPDGIDPERYPAYYRRNFHWQTDGWFSERSARLYDIAVEMLFGGTADVMRRMAIPPIVEVARDEPRLRVLDVACGTGRFLLQLRRAAPSAELYGVDLSAPYVARARGLFGRAPGANLLVANAEALPFRDASFDVVSCIFLFHELPRDARRNVAGEVLRVLRPGGRFVICDAAQLSDANEIAFFLEQFQELYHEPYFKSYLRDDLTRMLSEVGFEAVASGPRFVSKIAVGTKARGR